MGKRKSKRDRKNNCEDKIGSKDRNLEKEALKVTEEDELKNYSDFQKETDDAASAASGFSSVKGSSTFTMPISNYSYDQTMQTVEITTTIPGIKKHSKDKISLTASEFTLSFLVDELDGKNWYLNISKLPHEIIQRDVNYIILNKDKVVLVLRKKRPICWSSLAPTDQTVQAEWLDVIVMFFESLSKKGFMFNNFNKVLDDIWGNSVSIVRLQDVNLFSPSERVLNHDLLRRWFKTNPRWSTFDEVIDFAKRKINENVGDCVDHFILFGVALLKKLILRCKDTNAFRNVHIPEDNEKGHHTFVFKLKIEPNNKPEKLDTNLATSSGKSEINVVDNEPINIIPENPKNINLLADENSVKVDTELPPIEVGFRISNKQSSNDGKETSLVERLAVCLEERAFKQFNANNFAASAETLNEVINLFPDRSHLYSNRAACYLKLEMFKDSLGDGLKAVQLDRSNIDGWLCVGESNFALGTSDACIQDLEKISDEINTHKLENLLSKFKKLSDVLSNAFKAFENSDFETAAKYYLAASKVSVSTLLIKLKLSECFVLSGKFDKAVAMADKLLKDKNSEATGYCILGLNFYYQNMKVAAFENFDKCLSIDDHEKCKELYKKARDVYFYKDRGNEYFNSKRYDVAFEMYSKGQNVDPKNKIMNAIFNFNIGLTFLQQQKVADAIRSFSIAIDLHNEYIKALLKRADIYREVHQFQDAVTDLEAVCKITPSPRHKKLLQEAKAELKLQKTPQKLFCSLPEKEQNTILAVSKKDKGNKLFRSQDYHRANELYSAAITLDPDCPLLYSNRSACQLMLQNYDESMMDAVKSLELDGTYVKGYLRKGKVELILGKGEVALQTFKEGLKIDPQDENLKEQKDKAIKLISAITKGNDAFEKNDFVKAADWFSEAVVIASNNSDLLSRKLESILYCNQKFIVPFSFDLFDLRDKDANFYYITALTMYLKNYMYESFSNLNKALEIDVNHSRSKILMQKIMEFRYYILEGIEALSNVNRDLVSTRFLFQKAMEVDPQNKCICEFMIMCQANCLFLEKKYQLAIDLLSKCIETNNFSCDPYIIRSLCYSMLNNYEDCVKDLNVVSKAYTCSTFAMWLDSAKQKLKQSKMKNYYKILGVGSTATTYDINNAYTMLMKNSENHSTVTLEEIIEAYDVLSNPLKRERYDRERDTSGVDIDWHGIFNMVLQLFKQQYIFDFN